jgi:hypothetical protein
MRLALQHKLAAAAAQAVLVNIFILVAVCIAACLLQGGREGSTAAKPER